MKGEEWVALQRFSRIEPVDDRARCYTTFGWRMLDKDALVELQSVGQVGCMGITISQGGQTPACLNEFQD